MGLYYNLLKHALFRLNPEKAHYLTLNALKAAHEVGISKLFPALPKKPVEVMGFTFPNPVGLAAGMDKNGEYIEALAALGFGFIEVGTLTPKPQTGNPKPRLFRLTKEEAIINRMGFNNKGVDFFVEQIKQVKYKGILGVNIGKNAKTPNEKAVEDYLYCFRRVYPYAGYVVINISSPNTEGLRDLQAAEALKALLHSLKKEQKILTDHEKRYVPLVVKISPDLSDDALADVATVLLAEGIDGVIATNTTLRRTGVEGSPFANEVGGLSGKPLTQTSATMTKKLYQILGSNIPIISVGGIMTAADAKERFQSGAALVQLYTGLIYEGPALLNEILTQL